MNTQPHKRLALLALALIVLLPTSADAQKKLPRVLIIGDSISIGYTKPTQQLLNGKADVRRIPGNGGHTGRGLENLDKWLGKEKWDVIHFNWGLWDLAYRPGGSKIRGLDKKNGKQTWSPEEYDKNLRQLVKRLKASGAKLIWATTTPVPPGEPGRIVGDAIKYNAVAAKIMKENEITINDLHAHILPKMKQFGTRPGNVHFTAAGSKYLAEKVTGEILKVLGERGHR